MHVLHHAIVEVLFCPPGGAVVPVNICWKQHLAFKAVPHMPSHNRLRDITQAWRWWRLSCVLFCSFNNKSVFHPQALGESLSKGDDNGDMDIIDKVLKVREEFLIYIRKENKVINERGEQCSPRKSLMCVCVCVCVCNCLRCSSCWVCGLRTWIRERTTSSAASRESWPVLHRNKRSLTSNHSSGNYERRYTDHLSYLMSIL